MYSKFISTAFALAALSSTATAALVSTSPLNNKSQLHSNLCWNATARNLIYQVSNGRLNYAQCVLADYALLSLNRLVSTYGSSCNWPAAPFTTTPGKLADAANQPNLMTSINPGQYGPQIGTSLTINHFTGWTIQDQNGGPLTFAAVQNQINANRSAEIGIFFYQNGKPVGGHNILLTGYQTIGSTNYVQIFDPEPSGGGTKLFTYSALVSEPFNNFAPSNASSQSANVTAKWVETLTVSAK